MLSPSGHISASRPCSQGGAKARRTCWHGHSLHEDNIHLEVRGRVCVCVCVSQKTAICTQHSSCNISITDCNSMQGYRGNPGNPIWHCYWLVIITMIGPGWLFIRSIVWIFPFSSPMLVWSRLYADDSFLHIRKYQTVSRYILIHRVWGILRKKENTPRCKTQQLVWFFRLSYYLSHKIVKCHLVGMCVPGWQFELVILLVISTSKKRSDAGELPIWLLYLFMRGAARSSKNTEVLFRRLKINGHSELYNVAPSRRRLRRRVFVQHAFMQASKHEGGSVFGEFA